MSLTSLTQRIWSCFFPCFLCTSLGLFHTIVLLSLCSLRLCSRFISSSSPGRGILGFGLCALFTVSFVHLLHPFPSICVSSNCHVTFYVICTISSVHILSLQPLKLCSSSRVVIVPLDLDLHWFNSDSIHFFDSFLLFYCDLLTSIFATSLLLFKWSLLLLLVKKRLGPLGAAQIYLLVLRPLSLSKIFKSLSLRANRGSFQT